MEYIIKSVPLLVFNVISPYGATALQNAKCFIIFVVLFLSDQILIAKVAGRFFVPLSHWLLPLKLAPSVPNVTPPLLIDTATNNIVSTSLQQLKTQCYNNSAIYLLTHLSPTITPPATPVVLLTTTVIKSPASAALGSALS